MDQERSLRRRKKGVRSSQATHQLRELAPTLERTGGGESQEEGGRLHLARNLPSEMKEKNFPLILDLQEWGEGVLFLGEVLLSEEGNIEGGGISGQGKKVLCRGEKGGGKSGYHISRKKGRYSLMKGGSPT